MSNAPSVNQLRHLDRELDTVLASFDTNYVWNYGSVKEGLHDLYEKVLGGNMQRVLTQVVG